MNNINYIDIKNYIKMSIVKLHHNWYSMENAHQIIPRIWLGNYFSAQDAQFIHDNGISVVIN